MHLYPLLLFAIIVLSLLFLVMTGTGLYSAVVDSQTRNREARAALSYLAARVHAADAAGAVSVGEGPEGAALLLRENADGETYETRIYLYDGALREEYGTADAVLAPQDADRIVVMLQDRDAKTAEEIILDDDKLDALHHKTFDLALSDKWTGSRQQLIDVVLLGRFMERLGDHAVSASRRVVYIVSGFDPSKEPSRDEDGAVE